MSGKESASKSLFSRLSNWGSGQNEEEDGESPTLDGASLEEMFAEDSSSSDEEEAMEPAAPVPTPAVKTKAATPKAKASKGKAKAGAPKPKAKAKKAATKKSSLSVSSKGAGKKGKKHSPRSAMDADGNYIIPGATLRKIFYKVGSHRTAPAALKALDVFMHAAIEQRANVVYGLVTAQGRSTCGVRDLEDGERLIALQDQWHILGDLNADVAPYVKVEKKQKDDTEEGNEEVAV